ncbi:hypothetical protein H8E52_04105 [bacterium]|nr:hypothetical protein [bacterium]
MFELGLLAVGLLVLMLFGGLLLTLLGLVFKLILLPLHLVFWLFRGILGVAVSLLLLLVLLPMLGVVLPVFLLIFAWPLALVAMIVGLVKMGAGASA